MNKRYILAGVLAAALSTRGRSPAQPADSLFTQKTLRKTEVRALFSLYSQDGDHAAVTGGAGTEALTVYATEFAVEHTTAARHVVTGRAGADVISSASTDRIDFVASSASRIDVRSHADVSLAWNLPRRNAVLTAGAGLSSESDYLSLPFALSFEKRSATAERSLLVTARLYLDDLRWGRYTHGFFHPQHLVYPAELRYREWYDTYRRRTWQAGMELAQAVGRHTLWALRPGFIYQQGLLATPFQRVYFTDDSVRTENFPKQRFRFPVALQCTYRRGSRTLFTAGYLFYADNFGIRAHALECEVPVRGAGRWSLAPFARFYTQTGASFFRPYGRHAPEENFYTSDYDLSAFTSLKGGLALHLLPASRRRTGSRFREIDLRYSAYFRSDGLTAQAVSLLLLYGHE
jgi:hypothetical protein